MRKKRRLRLGYVPEMCLVHSHQITRSKAFAALLLFVGTALGAIAGTSAQAKSSVLLEAPADRSSIGAVTFDDSGAAVGQSSFELEALPNGHSKMTVRMAIEGGGHSTSEAIFAPVPVAIPSIGPAEKRPQSVDPQAAAIRQSGLPSVDSPPPTNAADGVDEAAPSEVADAAGEAVSTTSDSTPTSLFGRGPIAGLRLVEQRSQSTRADGTSLEVLVVNHISGYMTCTPDGEDPNLAERLTLPKKDRVVNVPMQLFFLPLVRGEVKELRFQIAMCKDGPSLYEMIAVRGPRKKLGEREVLEIRYGPNLGKAVAFLASRLMPTFSFWFDAKTGAYLGHRMPLYRNGPEVTLVRTGISPPAIGLSWR